MLYEASHAEFIGWYFGDGCLSRNERYSEFVLAGDLTEENEFYRTVIVPSLQELFSKDFQSPITLKEYPSVGVCGVYIFEQSFVKLLSERFNLVTGGKLNKEIPDYINTRQQKIDFIRGLFDTDGSIYFGKSYTRNRKKTFCNLYHYKPKIKLGLTSKKVLDKSYQFLSELGFSPRYYAPRKQRPNEQTLYSFVIDTKSGIERWLSMIGFRNSKHSTKIMLWKKYGFCPPYTTIAQRKMLFNGNLNPHKYYSKEKIEIKKEK